jgi:hypothetical protein
VIDAVDGEMLIDLTFGPPPPLANEGEVGASGDGR